MVRGEGRYFMGDGEGKQIWDGALVLHASDPFP